MTAALAIPAYSPNQKPSQLRSAFNLAAHMTAKTIKAVGSLAYDFAKTHPILTAVALDLSLTGGVYTQIALVSATKTIGLAVGEIGISAGQGLWGLVFK